MAKHETEARDAEIHGNRLYNGHLELQRSMDGPQTSAVSETYKAWMATGEAEKVG